MKLILNVARYFAISCILYLSLSSPIFAGTDITKEIKGQNVYITVAEKPDKPWWRDSVLQFVTIISGFLLVVFQLGKQHKNAIK